MFCKHEFPAGPTHCPPLTESLQRGQSVQQQVPPRVCLFPGSGGMGGPPGSLPLKEIVWPFGGGILTTNTMQKQRGTGEEVKRLTKMNTWSKKPSTKGGVIFQCICFIVVFPTVT